MTDKTDVEAALVVVRAAFKHLGWNMTPVHVIEAAFLKLIAASIPNDSSPYAEVGRRALRAEEERDVKIREAAEAWDFAHEAEEERDEARRVWNPWKRAESRQGMVTVYNDQGVYVGCMGRETWEKLLAEETKRRA